jgi:hypothetical protein
MPPRNPGAVIADFMLFSNLILNVFHNFSITGKSDPSRLYA